MKKENLFFISIVLILTLQGFVSFAQPCKEVIAYYPNWQWYDRGNLVGPQSIDYSNYSIINYSFFSPQADGSINQTDTWADENLLFGQHDWANGGYLPNTSLIDIAHTNGVDVLVSIGGWTLSNNFPGIASDSVKRSYFASECVRLLSDFGFDGIDIDWEYPGYAPHNGTVNDIVNFTLLMQEIRDSIDAYGLVTGTDFLLSSCFSADPVKMASIEWTNILGTIDMFNLMSYDFFGAFSALSNHNSPLYAPLAGDPQFNIHSAFTNLTQVYGVPASKINIGIPFYGRSVTGCTGLHQTSSGYADASTFWEDEGSPTYYNVLKNMNQFTPYWDSVAAVPYMLGNTINTFVSYDDEQSIALKAEYVVNNGARGVIIWELTGDYVETTPGSGIIAGTPLADTLNQVLCSIITDVEEVEMSNSLVIYPNPVSANSKINIEYVDSFNKEYRLLVYSISGVKVLERNFNNNVDKQLSVDISIGETGTYIIKLINGKDVRIGKLVICK